MRVVGLDRARIIGVTAIVALAFAAPAVATDVERSFSEIDIEGDSDADVITVSSNGVVITVTDTGPGGATTSDLDCTQVNPQTVTCPIQLAGQEELVGFDVELNNGVDSFTNQNFVTQFGNIDADGSTGPKTIVAGPGRQSIDGSLNSDTIDGGDGDDFLFDGGGISDLSPTGGNDLLVGGPGDDTAEYFRQDVALSVILDGLPNDGQAGETDNVQVENVVGGLLGDTLIGDESSNVLLGGGGGDLIRGMGGNDELGGDFGFGGGAFVVRGFIAPSGSDTLDGGVGRDGLDCGGGYDTALRDPDDDVRPNCERIGAEVVGDSARVSGRKKNKKRFKVRIACPTTELKACTGTLKATADAKKIGKGKFSIASGETKRAKVKLSKRGRKALRKAKGSLLVSVEATTNEPGGVSVDVGRILVNG
jgi:uncharacterized protein YggU (UPF0235/DUF167 family)